LATRVVNDARAEFVDWPLTPGSAAAGRLVAELGLPRTVVLVSIRRGRELLIPHGDTRLEAGDVITALCERGSAAAAQWALNNPTGLQSG
jgi:cell volume regulation protein A